MKYVTTIGEREYVIEILDDRHVVLEGKTYEVDFDALSDQPVYSLLVDGKSYEAYVDLSDDFWQVLLHGRLFPAFVEDEREKRLRMTFGGSLSPGAEFHLKAPMPGLIIAVPVEEGQQVMRGDILVVLESMKMQNELKAPRAGLVSRLRVKQGDSVEQHQTLMGVT